VATAGYNSSVLATSTPSLTLTNEAMTDSGDHTTYNITATAHRALDKGTAVVVQAEYDEVQSVAITGAPTGGTFTLTFGGNTTGTIAFNALASVVQTALQGLASVGANNALVSGPAGGPWIVDFTAARGFTAQSLMTAASSLTGGSSPGVAIARLQGGAGFATISTGFTLYYANAHLTFTVAQYATTVVRLASGKYFPLVAIAQAHTSDFVGKMDMIDTSYFNPNGTYSYTPGLLNGTLKCDSWWLNTGMVAHLQNRDLLIGSFVLPSGNRYEGYMYVSDSDIKESIKSAVDEALTFQLTDSFFAA
jgi:hypothetical protein